MLCDDPLRIRNQYTGDWMYVSCNKCDGCLVESALLRSFMLDSYMSRFKYRMMVTLTYDNDHLPLLINNTSCICRMNGDVFPCPDYDLDDIYCFDPDSVSHPTNLCLVPGSCVAVLFKRDVQLFFKRLRKYIVKNYGKEFGFKYNYCGEYGTDGRRPHYHIIFMSNTLDYGRLQSACVECWKLCDWSRLEQDKCFEVCNSGCSSYVASYVNCSANCDGILSEKLFKPFCCRSKDLDFGTYEDDKFQITKFVNRKDNGRISPDGTEYLSSIDTAKITLPIRYVSTRIFHAYFSKPKGFDKIPSDLKCGCFAKIIGNYFSNTVKNICGYKFILSSSDYKFVLGYIRFCKLFNLNPRAYGSIMFYYHVFMDIYGFVSSRNLRLQMQTYGSLSKGEYYLQLYNTKLEDLDKRQLRLIALTKLPGSFVSGFTETRSQRSQRLSYKRKYYKFLLPKHLNYVF